MLGALARLFRRSEPGPVKVIVGLGNPGAEYERTRHNVGWWLLDHLAEKWGFGVWRRDGKARVAAGAVSGTPLRLVKPQTFMNLSGAALRPFLGRSAFSAERDLIVVVDDVAIPVGTFRFRAEGSAGGHNGLKSIEATLRHRQYARLRIGIGPAGGDRRGALADYVLDAAGKRETAEIRERFPELADALALWAGEGIERVMNLFNRAGR